MTRFLLLAFVVAACRDSGHAGQPPPTVPAGSAALAPDLGPRCVAQPFKHASPVPEASGAAWLTIGGKLSLVVISDSGNDGAYAVIDPESGETVEQGKLPLGEAGDDLEGAAARGEQLVAITSSGWIRVWEHRDATHSFELVERAYPVGDATLSNKQDGNHPATGEGMACGARITNCGRNYEGLCLVDPAHRAGPCVGFVASKADGALYCLTDENGELVAQHDQAIAITRPGALADCAFGDDGSLWAGSNLFDLANVYEVKGWSTPSTATVSLLAAIGVGFPETLAVRGEVFYRMSDTGGAPSLMTKYRCQR